MSKPQTIHTHPDEVWCDPCWKDGYLFNESHSPNATLDEVVRVVKGLRATVQRYSLIPADDVGTAYMELDPTGRYVLADEAEDAVLDAVSALQSPERT